MKKKVGKENFKLVLPGRCEEMKELAFLTSVVFAALTFLGAGYVLLHHGSVNAGYAVVPMALAVASIAFYRKKK